MSRSGIIQRLLLVTCVILCVFVSAVTAGESQDFADNTTQVPVVQEHVATTTTPIVQDLPVIARPSNMAPVNPAYLRYLQEQQQKQASGEQDSFNSLMSTTGTPVSSHPTGLIPSYEDLSHLKGTYVVDDSGLPSSVQTTTPIELPAKYDLRELGRVPPVKDQGNHGACWAFATLASLESTLLPNESWDFSENHMKNLLSDQYPDGFDRNYSKGGTHKMSTAYLVRWSGPVNQSDDPYNITSAYSPANLTVQKHVQRVDFIPDRKSSTDNTNIKTAVKAYGAVFTSYNVSDEIPAYWNADTNSYYYFGPDSANHAVAIVGWDDTWSRNNFSTVPQGDGAFIIKNSWGATWGDSGFFYCSYYDRLIGNESSLFLSSPPKNYDYIYQYDPLGWVTSIYTAGEKAGFAANVFNSTRKQNLSAVSFYTTDTNANYQVWVYVNPDNGPVLNSSGAAFTQSGTFANAGYHTIEIPNAVPLDTNDRFAVAVNLTNPTYNWSIAIQDTSVETSKARAFPGRGYTSDDGSTWTDVTTPADQKNATLCIKAFTKDVQEPDLVGEIEADRAPTKFQNGTVFLNATLRIENEGTEDVNQPFTIKSNLLGKISDKRISDPIPVGRSKIICVNLWVIPGYGATQESVSHVGDIEYNTIITEGSIPVGQNFIGGDIDIDNEIDETEEGNNNVSRMVFVTDASIMSANFTSNVTSGTAPLTVQFTDTTTGEPGGWAWFFGDEKYTQPWTQMNASAGWPVRFDHSSVTLPDGSIVLSGGNSSPNGLMNDVWRSTDNGATWTRMTSHAEWTARFEHSTVAMPDGSIVLSGGSATDGIKQDVWRSTNKGANWTQMTTSAEWGKRTDHSSVAMPDGSIILTGGYISSGYYKNDTWRSVNNGSSWTSVNASSGWTRRYHHTSVVLPDESIVLMGGYDSIIGRRNDTWRSVNGGATWTLMNASSGWTARYEHTSVAMPDGSILLMGGSATDGLKNDMWRSKDCGRTWSRVDESAAWKARGWQTTVALPDGSIVLIGGGYEGVNYNNDVWRLVPTGSSLQHPSHTYTVPGTYPVTLQVYNTVGSNTTVKDRYIVVYPEDNRIVQTDAGYISGINQSGLRIYLGIPFAAPPTGNLRWRPPAPVQPWEGIKETIAYSANPPQPPSPGIPPAVMSEDCLYLNVWTPAKSANETLPVMVFFYGGAFGQVAPFGTTAVYNGTTLADKGVIVVTANYRLGALGFLAHPQLDNESVHNSSGNYGLMDQVAALKWVQRNIGAFGGNASQVTIFGQSAGGESILIHLVSPESTGLFQQAIVESGTFWTDGAIIDALYSKSDAEQFGEEYAQILGYPGPDAIAQMRNVSYQNLINATPWPSSSFQRLSSRHFEPTIDGWIIPDSPDTMFRQHKENPVTFMIGTNANDGATLASGANMTVPEYKTFVRNRFGTDAEVVLLQYPANSTAEVQLRLEQIMTDYDFSDAARFVAGSMADLNQSAYLYRYSYILPGQPYGAFHGSETLLLFNLPDIKPDPAVANNLVDLWTRFAKTGNPNGGMNVTWSQYNRKDAQYLDINETPVVGPPVPVANFAANMTSGLPLLAVQFADTSSGFPSGWNWSFGDGTFSIVQNPVHSYMLAGNYTVTLTASNSVGSNTTVKDRYIVIYPMDNRIIQTDAGYIYGINQSGLRVYLGIPFAAPPTGNLRWRPPAPVQPWEGIKETTAYSANPPQPPSSGVPPAVMSEDCLYLNVWTPAKSADEKLPVMVFFYGGAFGQVAPYGTIATYNGTTLAEKGVIVVTANYRLGTLGFLAHPQLDNESVHNSSGNYGLMDQVATLNWVQRNIGAFGGNSSQVTIFGQSAGGESVLIHLVSPESKGLYQQAIVESGPFWANGPTIHNVHPKGEAEQIGVSYVTSLGYTGPDAIAQMRNRSVGDLINATPWPSSSWNLTHNLQFEPTIDGWILPDSVNNLFLLHQENPVPLMIGTNANDGTTLSANANMTVPEYVAFIHDQFGKDAEVVLLKYPANSTADVQVNLAQIMTHYDFSDASRFAAGSMADLNPDTYLYRYSYILPGQPNGAFHGSETLLLFNLPGINADPAVAANLVNLWTRFAKTGNPNGGMNVTWSQYTRKDALYLDINETPVVGPPVPVANFAANSTSGHVSLTVQFADTSSGFPSGWNWSFGDGTWVNTSNTLQNNPSHTYTAAGTYTVSLTSANSAGSNTTTKTGFISVTGNTPDRTRLILPDVSHYQNTVTSTPIRVMNLTSGTGISFNLTYDPSVIQVNEITLNESYVSGSSLEVNATLGLIRLALTRTEPITIGSPVPLFFLNTTGTGPVGSSTLLNFSHAMWSTPVFDSPPMDTVNGSILIYRIRGDLNGNGGVDIGDTAKTAYMVVKLTPDLVPDADFNNNGVIDTGDATKIACYLVGRVPSL